MSNYKILKDYCESPNYTELQNNDELQDNNLGGFPDYAIGAINDKDNKSGVIMDSGGGGETKYAKCDNFTQPSDLVPYFSGKSDTIQYMHCADAYKGGGAFYCTAQENEKEEDKIQCCDGIDKGVVGYIIPPLVPGQDIPDGAVHPLDITKAQCVVPNVPISRYGCANGVCQQMETGTFNSQKDCEDYNTDIPNTCKKLTCHFLPVDGSGAQWCRGQKLKPGDTCQCDAGKDADGGGCVSKETPRPIPDPCLEHHSETYCPSDNCKWDRNDQRINPYGRCTGAGFDHSGEMSCWDGTDRKGMTTYRVDSDWGFHYTGFCCDCSAGEMNCPYIPS